MYLTVSGITESTVRYRFLWGWYVRGFKPWLHCQPCLRGTRARGINPEMGNVRVELDRPTDYFYLCGFAPGPTEDRGKYNLHLAVEPMDGEIATAVSAYGPIFTIHGARNIEIQDPIESLVPSYGRCKNFRFAAQVYPAPVLGCGAERIPILRKP